MTMQSLIGGYSRRRRRTSEKAFGGKFCPFLLGFCDGLPRCNPTSRPIEWMRRRL
jgi:hypothetical protein